MAKEFNRIVNFLIGSVTIDRKTAQSFGINLGFQDVENRQTAGLDRWYFWAQFDELLSQVAGSVEKLRAAPKIKVGDHKERPFMRILMPSTRKDEEDCFYCLYLPDAEKPS